MTTADGKGWTVFTPASQEGPMEHPAETETLYESDGWTLALVKRFCAANNARIIREEPHGTR